KAICDRLLVMYAGHQVEYGPTSRVGRSPTHPYTEALLRFSVGGLATADALRPLPGSVPTLGNFPGGCRFGPRCPYVTTVCHEKVPRLSDVGTGGDVASRCVRHGELS